MYSIYPIICDNDTLEVTNLKENKQRLQLARVMKSQGTLKSHTVKVLETLQDMTGLQANDYFDGQTELPYAADPFDYTRKLGN